MGRGGILIITIKKSEVNPLDSKKRGLRHTQLTPTHMGDKAVFDIESSIGTGEILRLDFGSMGGGGGGQDARITKRAQPQRKGGEEGHMGIRAGFKGLPRTKFSKGAYIRPSH